MNKITFKMNADDYYIGQKFKNKKIGASTVIFDITCVLASIAIILINIFILKSILNYVLAVLIVLLPIYRRQIDKKGNKNLFNKSFVLNGEQTLFVDDKGIQIINGFEKIFCPYGTILGIKETADLLIILPVIKKGVFVINKNEYKCDELDEIIKVLKEHEKVEVAKK